ncbi:hypothetical protein AGMMS50276_32560 [Synergistales bacterium]|nr:hypothetical protein AGMMS50276_32560 [Synergistales bacterium]
MLDNRKMLEDMLYGVGLDGNPSEWWHYQLPCFEQYPIIGSMNDIEVMN